jgi:hypothetical protein
MTYLKSVFQSLTLWKHKLYDNHLIGSNDFNIILNPRVQEHHRLSEEDVEGFFVLFWLAVEYDTVMSPLIDKPISILDEQILPNSQKDSHSLIQESPNMGFDNLWKLAITSASKLTPAHSSFSSPYDPAMILEALHLAVPTSILLWRKYSVLRNLLHEDTTGQPVEQIISSTVQVVNHWCMHFMVIMQACVDHHSALSFDIQVRYVYLSINTRLACLLIADCIEQLDTAFKSNKVHQLWRSSACFVLEMKKENTFAIAEMARASCRHVTLKSGYHEFTADHGALLGEPWPVVLEFGLTKSCEILLNWISQSNHPCHENALYLWISASTDVDELISQAQDCIEGLERLSWKSKTSSTSAKRLQLRLKRLISERRSSEHP